MSGLLSGLDHFGLGKLEGMTLFEAPKEKEAEGKAAAPVMQEQDFIFDKTYTCPVCDKEFKEKTVKVGKAKLTGSDRDMRPRYEQIDMLKYDVIMCPHCGYTSLSRYFKFLTGPQLKKIKENICANFKPAPKTDKETYSYEDALERYKMALVNAIVKQTKASEKAYICLKTGWLLRGQGEDLDKEAADYQTKKADIDAQENEFLKNAFDGFLAARQSEGFPMCGMDECTVDYLIAVLAMRFGQYDVSSKLIAGVIVSPVANPRMKERARDVKEELVKKIKEKKAAK